MAAPTDANTPALRSNRRRSPHICTANHAAMHIPNTQVKLVKNQSGQWEVVEVVTTPKEGLTASGLQSLEDFFNGK